LAPKTRAEVQIPRLDREVVDALSQVLAPMIEEKIERERVIQRILENISLRLEKYVRFTRSPPAINPTAPISDLTIPIDKLTTKFLQEVGVDVYHQDIENISGNIAEFNFLNTALCLADFLNIYYKLKPLAIDRRMPSSIGKFNLDIFLSIDSLPSTNITIMTISSLIKSLMPEINVRIKTNERKIWSFPLSTLNLIYYDKINKRLNFNKELITCYEIAYQLDINDIWWNVSRLAQGVLEGKVSPKKKYGNLWNYIGRSRKGVSNKRSIKAIEHMARKFRNELLNSGFAENLDTKQHRTTLTQTGIIFWKLFTDIVMLETDNNPFSELWDEYNFVRKCVGNYVTHFY
jgi:hypothetical protein